MHPFRTLSLLVAMGAMVAVPLAASAAELRVAVSDGPAAPAVLYVALFDTAEAMTADKALAAQTLPMREGEAQLVFVGLPPGRYALKSFADENGNGKLDTNLVGVPIERYGFSNEARGRMGPPAFDAAAVPLEATGGSIALRLH